ncbi:MAG TPA: hypothetical protein VFY16_08605 [Gemmatimonadaceae bacterium]|nr:hypothetical protein [Gemmatimonadaceae bacterium]
MSIARSDIDEAVRRGVLDADQRDALLAIAAERPEGTAAREARRGLNWVTVSYALGAGVVVAAFGWYLADRWRSLGPGGTLAVSLLYAALFVGTGRLLRGERFPLAGGMATLLAVTVAPVVAWALLAVLDLWPAGDPGWSSRYWAVGPWNASGWLVVDLATLLAALVAMRRVRFAPLALPAGIALAFAGVHLTEALFVGGGLHPWMTGRALTLAGAALLAIGYAADRRRTAVDGPDHARWLYLVGLATLQLGLVAVWSDAGAGRHWLPLVAFVQTAAALQLRRTSFLAAAAVNGAWYVGFLAFSVFRDVVSFPVALATVGALVLVGTVLVQRRLPRLVPRLDRDRPGRVPAVTAGWISVGGVVVIALAFYLAGIPDARERLAAREWQERLAQLRLRNEHRRVEEAAVRER